MGMDVVLCFAGLIAVWMMLSIMGGERQRQIQARDADTEAAARTAAAEQPAPASHPSTPPSSSPPAPPVKK